MKKPPKPSPLIRLPWPLTLPRPTLGTVLPQGRVVISKPGELTLI